MNQADLALKRVSRLNQIEREQGVSREMALAMVLDEEHHRFNGSAPAGASTPPRKRRQVRESQPAGAVTDPTYQRIRNACCEFSPIDLDDHAARATLDVLNARAHPRHPFQNSSGGTASTVRASGRPPEEVTG